MKREIKEITTQDLEDIIGFDLKPKKEKKKANTVKINEELYNELSFYKYLTPADRGELLEDIAKYALKKWGYSFIVMKDKKMLYIVKDFKKLKTSILEQMLYIENEDENRSNGIIEISMNRKDKYKDTKIVSIAFTDMKKLGVDVISYDIIEEQEVQKEKILPTDQSRSIS